MADGNREVFQIRALQKVYGDGPLAIRALDGVDLDLFQGELVVLLGPSGSGKSTFLNILGGLDRPTSGDVLFEGRSLGALDERALTRFRRDHVGFVFQFYNLIPSLTAAENVALVTEIASRPMAPGGRAGPGRARASGCTISRPSSQAASSSGWPSRAPSPSGRPCCSATSLPGALDSKTGGQVLRAIDDVNRELGATTAVITHNAAIAGMADRVVRFADGRLAEVRENARRQPISELAW